MNESSTTARRQQFERWARNAAALIEANPREYKLRVALLAALGYVVVFGLLAVLVGLIGGSIWAGLTSVGFLVLLIKKKLIVVLGMLVYSLVKALWVKLDPPTGYALSRARFPELHREVETLQHELLTPRIHEILLTDQFNASVQQTPRLGIFG